MNAAPPEFFGAGNDIRPEALDAELQGYLGQWRADIAKGGIGFLPRSYANRLTWYAFAPTDRQRRELLALLDAWLGATYSDLAVNRGELHPNDPFDAALAVRTPTPLCFEVLPRTPPRSAEAKQAVRAALLRITRLVNGRPPSPFDARRTTVEVLDDLGHAIAAQDRVLAEDCLAELERSGDLDESNLAFLRLRTHAGLGDWAVLCADPALAHVLSMRRPIGVTRALQLALYHQTLAPADTPGAEADLLARARDWPVSYRDLSTGAEPTSRGEAVVELLTRLLQTAANDAPAVASVLEAADRIQAGLAARLQAIVAQFLTEANEPESVTQLPVEAPPDATSPIVTLLLAGDFTECIRVGLDTEPTAETGSALVFAATYLNVPAWSARVMAYLRDHAIRDQVAGMSAAHARAVEQVEQTTQDSAPRSWQEWFARLTAPGATGSPVATERGDSWEVLPADEFAQLINNASDEALAKLGEHSGQFLAAHQAHLTAPGAADLALRLIAALAYGEKSSLGIRAQTLALLESLASAGMSLKTLRELTDWTLVVLDTNLTVTTVAWACDVVQTVTAIPSPASGDVLLTFLHKTFDLIRPYRSALDAVGMEGLRLLAAELGTELPTDFAVGAAVADADPGAAFQHLRGLRVALYSLTESAINRAAQILRTLVAGVDVVTNSEHDGSAHLAQLSNGVDIFVIVTASAKHAATNFIEEHRGGQPTLRVNSRGSSAILRSLSDVNI